jgi:hypothetical protein
MMNCVHLKNRQQGVAAVEFGILIIPLTLMLFGLTEYGRAIYQYNTLVKATRDAARYLSTVEKGNGWTEARCLARYGNTACTGPLLAPDLADDKVFICDASIDACAATHASVSTGSGAVNLVTVTISGFEFHSLINFPVGGLSIGAPNITFSDISNTMRQAL